MTKKEQAIAKAREIIRSMSDAVHAESHIEQVMDFANQIVEEYPEADRDLLEIAVWWHDTGRSKSHASHANHAEIGGQIVKMELAKMGFDSSFTADVSEAVASHSNSSGTAPATLEAKILKDADKLDFLTISRWKACMEAHEWWAIEGAIEKIPLIRNKILSLEVSRKIFDQLFKELISFSKNCTFPGFEKYKDQVLSLKIEK